jgi:hypothetical protein
MLIESSNISMESTSSFVQQHSSITSVTSVNQSLEASHKNTSIKILVYNSEENLSFEDRIKKLLIELLLEKISDGRHKIELFPFSNENSNKKYMFNENYAPDMTTTAYAASYENIETYYQKSSVDFSSHAQINTSNGSYNIDLNFSFSNEFYERHRTRIDIAGVNLQDPLIINYNGGANSFDNISQSMTFEFDINSDGTKENIPLLKDGSGFLALDKNENGQIDDGGELFGPNSSDGFEELAQYDEDGNNWIDEADSIYNDLRIWQINEDGENQLITLAQAGVGAIYLSSIESGFNYSKAYGEQTASLKEASIFLKENGEAGLVTSVDLAV